MAKRLSDIGKSINESNLTFLDYLENNFSHGVLRLLEDLSEVSKPYIFSGVIRNYFLNKTDNRDLDIFIDGYFDIESLFIDLDFRRNSYGGYKIKIDNTNIDLWFLRDTWSINNSQLNLDFDIVKYIPQTAFFNFSSIIFSLQEKKFHYTKHFLRFLRDKKIDVVFTHNPNDALCIVNTFYYSEKLKLKLGDKLKAHIKKVARRNLKETITVQEKHFGKIIYSIEELNSKIMDL